MSTQTVKVVSKANPRLSGEYACDADAWVAISAELYATQGAEPVCYEWADADGKVRSMTPAEFRAFAKAVAKWRQADRKRAIGITASAPESVSLD